MFYLKENEVLEDLQINNFYIIQNHKKYCFSVDSVLLSNFVKIKKNDFVVELCSGSGIISILLVAKYKIKQIIGFEIEKDLFDMSIRSKVYNKINNIQFINDDLINAKRYLRANQVDVIVCNPPYYVLPKDYSKISHKNLVSKYEVKTNITQILKTSNELLNEKGRLYLVYPFLRLQELLTIASSFNLIAKTLQFVYPKNKIESSVVLVELIKNANKGIKVLKPLII